MIIRLSIICHSLLSASTMAKLKYLQKAQNSLHFLFLHIKIEQILKKLCIHNIATIKWPSQLWISQPSGGHRFWAISKYFFDWLIGPKFWSKSTKYKVKILFKGYIGVTYSIFVQFWCLKKENVGNDELFPNISLSASTMARLKYLQKAQNSLHFLFLHIKFNKILRKLCLYNIATIKWPF